MRPSATWIVVLLCSMGYALRELYFRDSMFPPLDQIIVGACRRWIAAGYGILVSFAPCYGSMIIVLSCVALLCVALACSLPIATATLFARAGATVPRARPHGYSLFDCPHGCFLFDCPHGCFLCDLGAYWHYVGSILDCVQQYFRKCLLYLECLFPCHVMPFLPCVPVSVMQLLCLHITDPLVCLWYRIMPFTGGVCTDPADLCSHVGGGRGAHMFVSHDVLYPYMNVTDVDSALPGLAPSTRYKFHGHVLKHDVLTSDDSVLAVQVPIGAIASSVTVSDLCSIIKVHDTGLTTRATKQVMVDTLRNHHCTACDTHVTLFKRIPIFDAPAKRASAKKSTNAPVPTVRSPVAADMSEPVTHPSPFPPHVLDNAREASIVRSCVDAMQPTMFQESGCTVCGQLKPMRHLSSARHVARFFPILENDDATRKERLADTDPVVPLTGPVLDRTTDLICLPCRASVRKGIVPKHALARDLWIGEVPEVLSRPSFVERLLVARVRHSCCFVRVALSAHPTLGSRKMISHVVAFESPLSKVYSVLPPPRDELDEVLAVMFTGPSTPTEEDMKRTPLLDVEVSMENLSMYEDGKAPVAVVYKDRNSNKVPEGTSVFDNDEADGTTDGPCPVVVHGLVGEHLDTLPIKTQKTMAARHFKANHGILAVGHAKHPESIYDNPRLYPSMFLWLFPYGLGGVGSTDLSDKAHKKWLLMYHDKRFQTDIAFPFVAFSHEQIKASTTGGFLLASKDKFFDISERLLRVDEAVLESLSDRMRAGETVVPATPAEKDCFQLINDLDHVAYKVQGSLTSKKYMRNEAYSLMAAEGAPSWYFTMAPSDHSHPICVYWAGN
ncbi:hypothetical protein ARMSODRAFT_943118, partial [Armillaria solidipes]